MKTNLTQLGRRSVLTPRQIASPRTILEAFANPRPQRDYTVEFVFPEFTSMCPVTGQPDFATITVTYVPDRLCVELKSLKFYLQSYRNRGIFYEAATNAILDDFVAAVSPRRAVLTGDFSARGGITTKVTVRYSKSAPK